MPPKPALGRPAAQHLQERSLLKKAFQSWLARRRALVAKRRVLERAVGRLARGTLLRCFYSWREELHLVDATLAMTRKVGLADWQLHLSCLCRF
jgi:hypothetical protein